MIFSGCFFEVNRLFRMQANLFNDFSNQAVYREFLFLDFQQVVNRSRELFRTHRHLIGTGRNILLKQFQHLLMDHNQFRIAFQAD